MSTTEHEDTEVDLRDWSGYRKHNLLQDVNVRRLSKKSLLKFCTTIRKDVSGPKRTQSVRHLNVEQMVEFAEECQSLIEPKKTPPGKRRGRSAPALPKLPTSTTRSRRAASKTPPSRKRGRAASNSQKAAAPSSASKKRPRRTAAPSAFSGRGGQAASRAPAPSRQASAPAPPRLPAPSPPPPRYPAPPPHQARPHPRDPSPPPPEPAFEQARQPRLPDPTPGTAQNPNTMNNNSMSFMR